MQTTTTITIDENNRVFMINEETSLQSYGWLFQDMQLAQSVHCLQMCFEISRFSDKQEKRSKTWKLIFAKDPQVTQRLECTLFADIFHIDIKPSFLFTSLTSLLHKTYPYTCVLESCFESFSQETIASSPLFSVCSGPQCLFSEPQSCQNIRQPRLRNCI